MVLGETGLDGRGQDWGGFLFKSATIESAVIFAGTGTGESEETNDNRTSGFSSDCTLFTLASRPGTIAVLPHMLQTVDESHFPWTVWITAWLIVPSVLTAFIQLEKENLNEEKRKRKKIVKKVQEKNVFKLFCCFNISTWEKTMAKAISRTGTLRLTIFLDERFHNENLLTIIEWVVPFIQFLNVNIFVLCV